MRCLDGTDLCRRVMVCDVTSPALVLGSTQPDGDVDWERAASKQVEVTRRSGGGGCVFLSPGAQVWLEVWLPRSDPLWVDDVAKSFFWLGDTWLRALRALGVRDVAVCPEASIGNPLARRICFAGRGPGEVLAGGRKVVGLSQRRNRLGSAFHVASLLTWDPQVVLELLVDDNDQQSRASESRLLLEQAARGLGDVVTKLELEKAFLAALPG